MQGSILSPFLFMVFIPDSFKTLTVGYAVDRIPYVGREIFEGCSRFLEINI